MSNKSQNKRPDSQIAGTKADQELEYWTKEFGISKDELKAAVKAGKTPAEAVEEYIKEVKFA
jgi:hypothetical protein